MKKRCLLLLAALLAVGLFTGCCMRHEWMRADCTDPKTCIRCDKTEGGPLGHTWQEATCTRSQVCGSCGVEQGSALGHSWLEADCTQPKRCQVCSHTEGAALGHVMDTGVISGELITGICTVCGQSASQQIDWSTVPQRLVTGRWEGILLTDGTNTVDAPEETYLEMDADGTCVTLLAGDEYTGTWEFYIHDTTDPDNPCLRYDAKIDGDDFQIFLFDEDMTFLYLSREGVVVIYQKA